MPRRQGQPSDTGPSDPAEQPELAPHPRRLPRRFAQSNNEAEATATEGTGPDGPVARNPRQQRPPNSVELEYIDPNTYSDLDDDSEPGEPPIPRARAPRRDGRGTTQPTETSTDILLGSTSTAATTFDPFESLQSAERAQDVHYFFEKRKGEMSTYIPCRYVIKHESHIHNDS
jgi:hypothetical protein